MTFATIKRRVLALKPVASFRIYCDRGKHGYYYHVLILDGRKAMTRAEKWLTGHRSNDPPLGFCQEVTVRTITRRGTRTSKFAGFIVMLNAEIGAGYVSHEMTHAAQYYVHRKMGATAFPLTDEPLALSQGWLVNQFWRNYYKCFPEELKYASNGRFRN